MRNISAFPFAVLLGFLALSCGNSNQELTNVALHRATLASSSYDFNMTAQLATDGIVEEKAPAGMHFFLNGNPVPKEEADWLLDERDKSKFTCALNSFDLELRCEGCSIRTDAIAYYGTFVCRNTLPYAPYSYSILVTEDGQDWVEAGHWEGTLSAQTVASEGGPVYFEAKVPLADYCGVRIKASVKTSVKWTFNELKFFIGGQQIEVRPSSVFSSYWLSRTGNNEWLQVDLGADTELHGLKTSWHNPPVGGSVEVSDDARNWKKIAYLNALADESEAEETSLAVKTAFLKGKARYVRLMLDRTENCLPFSLSEIEIYGWNGLKPRHSDWILARAGEKDNPSAWMSATVPGTVLSSFVDNGAVPDPFYSDNNTQISESYFLSDFIYRGKLNYSGDSEKVWLEFGGINWKADVCFNGQPLGRIEGAFTTATFDVSSIVRQGWNDVEVYIHRPAHPGSNKADNLARCARNGGKLGADNPTFHATVGWDWMPGVHDRNIGIWRDVKFIGSGNVTVDDPIVRTKLLQDGRAEVLIGATLTNHGIEPVDAEWIGSLDDSAFGGDVTIAPGESAGVSRTLVLDSPRLWWPNGYGEQNLYELRIAVSAGGVPGDSLSLRTGLRQMSYDISDGRLSIYVNGRRFIGRGGNWGFPEALLRYGAREYDIAVGLHAQANFNIIRNWVGQTGHEEFYEACDKYGIMVWQDFWLANPVDGPDPDDEAMFMANAGNYVRRIRNHPSIALYCGRNEGMPPVNLDKNLKSLVAELAPDLIYIPNSAADVVSGHGPYNRRTALQNFTSWGQEKFHSELGMPNVPNYESLVRFIPEDHLWPQDDIWGYHNWTRESAQSIETFNAAVRTMFGEPKDGRQFCDWAQWVNYDGFRSLFESRSACRRGLTLWMSHSAWPDLVFFTYDYYFDTDAGYFGCKKACEPLHIQWNPSTRMVEVVNTSAGEKTGITASAKVLDMYGKELSGKEYALDSFEDSTVECFQLSFPEGQRICYYSLALTDKTGELLSENFYVQGLETDDFKALLTLPEAKLKTCWKNGILTLVNDSDVPAMMIRIMAENAKGEQVLPAVYSDNYFHLMPGQTRSIGVRTWDSSGNLSLEVRGFNLKTIYSCEAN